MAGKGGARPGAGRKRDVTKDLKAGAASALKILKELKHEQAIVDLYKVCGDARLRALIIFRLRDMAFGKPIQAVDVEGKVDNTHKIEVEFIGGDV